jgi:NodT family efflux transporter outer membrane factor (OMF) lipoprotein
MSQLHRFNALIAAMLLGACATDVPMRSADASSIPSLPKQYHFIDSKAVGDIASLVPEQDPAFVTLRRQALQDAPSLAAALARVDLARASLQGRAAQLTPNVEHGVSAAKFKRSDAESFDADQTRLDVGINARWELDVFGRLRASRNAAQATLQSADADARAVRLSLIANIADLTVQWRALDDRERSLRADFSAAESLFRLTQVRVRAGLVAEFDQLRAQGLMDEAKARLAPLSGERASILTALAALSGQSAAEVEATLTQNLPTALSKPKWLSPPLAMPSRLLQDRPDVLAAFARLQAADAELAVASAARFPRISLSGDLGLLASSLSDWVDDDAFNGSVVASIAGPLLDFGRTRAEIKRQDANSRIAFADYRAQVFNALQEVERGYALVSARDAERQALMAQLSTEQTVAELANVRYRNGLSDFLSVLDAQRRLYATRARLSILEGEAARVRIALWLALGGK